MKFTPPRAPGRAFGKPRRSHTSTSASARAIDQRIVVVRRRRDAQPFHAARHGRIIDRLDVDAVLGEQQVARRFALLRIADQHRHDVRVARHHRQAGGVEHGFHARGAVLVALALPARCFQMPDRRGRRGADRRRQRGGEYKAGRVGAHRIDEFGGAGDIAAQTPERLGQAYPRSRRHGAWRLSRSQMPPPRGPYMPTA